LYRHATYSRGADLVRREQSVEWVDPNTGCRMEATVRAIDDRFCDHAVREGDYCPECRAEYRRANAE
jgi:hypothetical protein